RIPRCRQDRRAQHLRAPSVAARTRWHRRRARAGASRGAPARDRHGRGRPPQLELIMEQTGTMPRPMIPRPPDTLEEAGLPEELVAGLVIKTLHQRGSVAGFELSELLALPFPLLDDLLEQLQERRFIQVTATRGPTRGEYVFALTGEGRQRAAEELALSRYVGPAPISFDDFCRWIE